MSDLPRGKYGSSYSAREIGQGVQRLMPVGCRAPNEVRLGLHRNTRVLHRQPFPPSQVGEFVRVSIDNFDSVAALSVVSADSQAIRILRFLADPVQLQGWHSWKAEQKAGSDD